MRLFTPGNAHPPRLEPQEGFVSARLSPGGGNDAPRSVGRATGNIVGGPAGASPSNVGSNGPASRTDIVIRRRGFPMFRTVAMLVGRVTVMLACLSLPALPAAEGENPLRKLLREGKPVIGMTVTIASADVVLQAARLGFDFVWIEMEHSPITLETARTMVLATQGTGLIPIIRVPVNEIWTAKRALDTGALGVVFPFTSTPELARQAVAACHYPPAGLRGAGPGLAAMRWPAAEGYADFADQQALVVIIIEQKSAVENIDAILDVPGIDVVYVGVNDLSYSFGDRGKQTPPVVAAVARVVAAAKKRNLPVGRPTSAADVKRHLEEGFQFFQSASELGLIAAGARPLLEAAGKSAPTPSDRPLY